MATIYGRTNAKPFIDGGGGASLNLAYGLTPPDDTSKIWIQTATEPTSVKVSPENRAILNNEVRTTINMTLPVRPRANEQIFACKVGNYVYASQITGSSSDINISSNGRYRITRINLTTGAMDFIVGSGTSTQYYVLNKRDDDSFYYITLASSVYKLYYYTISTGVSTQIENFPTNWSNNYLSQDGDYIYYKASADNIWYRWNSITNTIENFEFTLPSGNLVTNVVIKNGKLYFSMLVNAGTTSIGTMDYYNYSTKVYYYNFSTGELVNTNYEVKKTYTGTYSQQTWTASVGSNGSLVLINDTPKIYGGYSDLYRATSSGTTSYAYCSELRYQLKIPVVDENNNVYLIGGRTYGEERWSYGATVSDLLELDTFNVNWQLDENKLWLSTYGGNGVVLPVVSESTLTMEYNLCFAWLGDSNNIAQAVNMYYYDNGTWKGINCADYSE